MKVMKVGVKIDWEEDLASKISNVRRETIRQKEERARVIREEEERMAREANELNELLEKANANIQYMAKKNKSFNWLLKQLTGGVRINLKEYSLDGRSKIYTIKLYLNLYLDLPNEPWPLIAFSYSHPGGRAEIVRRFQPKTDRDKNLFISLPYNSNNSINIFDALKELSEPESTINFFFEILRDSKVSLKNIPEDI